MPKIPVAHVNLTANERNTRECERDLGYVFRALRADNVESAAQAYASAVERGGNDFVEYCQKLPAELRAMLARVANR